METKQCKECGAFHGHSPECKSVTLEEAMEQRKQYYQAWLKMEEEIRRRELRVYGMCSKAKQNSEFWKGKFFVVKHENNVLRKKLK
jgi:predicted pyridoxine 5'-phosphate oxidase superfamily flavin-nucleotide-binding protein